MRLVLVPVEIAGPGIRSVALKRRRYRVRRILDRWRYGGRWWRGEPPRDYFLLELEGGRLLEVYQEAGRWVASRWLD